MTDSADNTQSRRIRILPEQWKRIEKAASGAKINPNDLLVQLAMEALDRRELFGKEAEVHVARASLFAAQLLARGLIAEGREHEIEEIRRNGAFPRRTLLFVRLGKPRPTFASDLNLTDVNVVVRASLQARSKLSSETHDDTVIVIVVQGDT